MIPTSATSSSPPTASVGSIGTNQMNNSPNIPGTANTNNGTAGVGVGGSVGSVGQGNLSAILGIASLILEGRALAVDEYAPQTTTTRHVLSGNANAGDCGRQSPKPSTSRAAFGDNYGGSGTTTTTNAMTNSFSIDLANYLGRKSSNSPDTTSSSSFLRDYYSSSGESAASSVESNHSRWSQKLSQLRQESPNAHHQVLAARQKIAMECARGSEAEYVALAINTDHQGGGGGGGGNGGLNDERRGGDFEILRRMSINQMNFYNSPSAMGSMGGGGGGGGSSENFMCSLQSLASNSCLRAGNPLLVTTTSPPRYSNNRQISSSSSARFITPSHHQQQQQLDISPNSSNNSSGSSTNSWYPATSSPPQMANSGNTTSNSSHNKEYLLRKSTTAAAAAVNTQRMPIPSATPNKSSLNTTHGQNQHSNIFNRNSFTTNLNSNNSATSVSGAAGATTIATSTPSATATQRNQTYPQQGPHCDQFLRKMGLAKGDALETEEHHCDMSYVNITCTRWRAYCIKMENILARGEPICIEVYLGPVGHKILLEQWIITQKDKQPPPTMTLPSLCSAIRSQLYFSQISAWCDLIKKSDKTIYETGRVIYTTPPTTSAAGDLATTNNVIQPQTAATLLTTSTQHQQQQHTTATGLAPSTSSSGSTGMVGSGVSGGVGCNKRRPSSSSSSSSAPRLNIFYRIKQYDSTACFNSKPNVHNFPNVNITENCSISVCLKSLPRITGGIPKVGTTTTATATQQQQQISPSAAVTTTTTPANVNTLTAKNVNKTAAASSAVAATTTSNANKSTILTMNCDNNLKELQQQQQNKTLTASLRCTFSNNRNNSKPSTTTTASQLEHNLKDQQQHAEQEEDIDLEYEDHHNIDINAAGGGDNSNISASSSLIASSSICGDGDIGGNSVGDCDSSNSSFSTNNCGNLSHREKQLLKYRKRMMKRDKKQQLRKTNEITTINKLQNDNKMEQGEDDIDDEVDEDIDNETKGDNMKLNNEGNNSDNNTAGYKELIKYSINNTKLAKGQRQEQQQQQQLPNNHINNNSNSIPCTTTTTIHVKMISTGTQTITNTCTSCGSEKSMICLKCNPFKTTKTTSTPTTNSLLYNYDEEQMDAETLSSASSSSSSTSSASSLSSSDIIHTPRNKAELLLQAIQRTPKSNKKHKHKSKDSQQQQQQMAAIKQQSPPPLQQHSPSSSTSIKINRKSSPNSSQLNGNSNNSNNLNNGVVSNTNNSRNININNSNSNSNNSNITMIGCQVCKRQKTQHHFNQTSMIEELSSSLDDNNSLAAHGGSSFKSTSNGIDAQQALITTVKQQQNPTALADDCGATDGDDEDADNEKDGGSILSNDCVDNVSYVMEKNDKQLHENGVEGKMSETKLSCDDFNEHEIMEEEYFETSTKLTPHIDRCSLNNKTYYEQMRNTNDTIEYQTRSCSTPPLEEQTSNLNGCSAGNSCGETTAMMAQFKTPTPSEQQQNVLKNKAQQQQQPLQPHKHTPKPNLLHIACNFNKNDEQQSHHQHHQQLQQQQQQISKLNHLNTMDNNTPTTSHNPLLLRRSLPKVNLTPIFCNPNSTMMVVSSSPIPIGNGVSNGTAETNGLISKSAEINITQASPTFSFESPSSPAPSITVQKSNSAPTLPNSPSLSPRFFKASAIYKRRSRHLSDRSDRSSLGSDEQFSDEDIDSGMYSPFATSPVKLRTRLAAVFGRKPLLGNLEECLLQRRLVPKIEVMGFKLLLGASGGFCPTQLTIPAAAYFYELKGETLSTPYLCEIRLPRKGYTVPRCGTVQATLLNPMGTVVRMFVIPYDMRDMPTLHQTFIRQRILADTGVQSNNNAEDVKQNGIGNDEKHFDVDLNSKSPQDLGQQQQQQQSVLNQQQRSPQCNNENNLGHFISAENMKSLRYSIHLRFQTSRSGRLMLHTDIRLLISRRTDCDTAAAHAKGVLEAPNELITNTVMPTNPKYSARQDQTSSKI